MKHETKTVIFALSPYKEGRTWLFDDPSTGLKREAFVGGASEIIDRLVRGFLGGKPRTCQLLFSASPFPGYDACLVWQREEHGGNWYSWPEEKMEGWLCPALFKYFSAAPKQIYAKILWT